MPAPTGSRSIACVEGMEEGLRGRSTTEVRTGGGGVAHTLSIAGTDTEVKEVIGTPSEEKTAGNTAFAAKDFAVAEKHYSKAIAQLEGKASQPQAAEMLKVCRLNRAASCLHLGDMAGAVRDCSDVLRVDPINVKALFRRAKASSNMRTDILSVSNAKQDLQMASIIKPNDPQIEALKAQVEADLPQLEEKLLALHYRDKPFWTVGEQVMVTKKGRMKLGGRGSLQPGDIGIVRDVDVELKAGGRVQVQNIKTADCYWYDMEEICRACFSEEEVDAGPAEATAATPRAEAPAGGPSPPSAADKQHHDDLQRLEQLRNDMHSKTTAAASAAAAAHSAASVGAAGPEEHEDRVCAETDEDAERDIDEILAAMQEELGNMGDVGRELLGPQSAGTVQRRDSPEEVPVAVDPTAEQS